MDEEPAAAVATALAATPEGRRFLAALREYLGTWGQRGGRWGWSFPSWIDDPTPVIKTLRDHVRQPDRDLDAELAAQAAERERLVAQARKRMRHHPPDVQDRFEFLLRAAQTAIVLTEDHSHSATGSAPRRSGGSSNATASLRLRRGTPIPVGGSSYAPRPPRCWRSTSSMSTAR